MVEFVSKIFELHLWMEVEGGHASSIFLYSHWLKGKTDSDGAETLLLPTSSSSSSSPSSILASSPASGNRFPATGNGLMVEARGRMSCRGGEERRGGEEGRGGRRGGEGRGGEERRGEETRKGVDNCYPETPDNFKLIMTY
ncbi:unnamed protein product [Pleuronectes platessa]|uniref:Uncharacterized protein n=1 Tax=Pleuronectes platessa TaxID=8262 RepID=A0A9N7UX89_PLEPL|nr:unnamed protein product [Pleuronectes platessa]